jgi:hypothetical protein
MPLTAESRWKEELVVRDEDGREFVFDCGWGADPLVAYIPSVESWSECVPGWLLLRRDEVVSIMRSLNHCVEVGDYPPQRPQE